MSFLSMIEAAEHWCASLFSSAERVETAIATVQANPVLAGAATAAVTVVTTELTKAGVPVEQVEDVGTKILAGLAAVQAAVPTVLTTAENIEHAVTGTISPVTAPVQPAS